MFTSLLDHVCKIRGDRSVGTDDRDGQIFVRIETPRESLRCSACGSPHVPVIERFRRQWRTLPIGAKAVWIDAQVPKVECRQCGARQGARGLAPLTVEQQTFCRAGSRRQQWINR